MKSFLLVIVLLSVSVSSFAAKIYHVNGEFKAIAKSKGLATQYCQNLTDERFGLVLKPCLRFSEDKKQAVFNLGAYYLKAWEGVDEAFVDALLKSSVVGDIEKVYENGDLKKLILKPKRMTNEFLNISQIGDLTFNIDEKHQTLEVDIEKVGTRLLYANENLSRVAFYYEKDKTMKLEEWLHGHLFCKNSLHEGIVNKHCFSFQIYKGGKHVIFSSPGWDTLMAARFEPIELDFVEGQKTKTWVRVISAKTGNDMFMLTVDVSGRFIFDTNDPDKKFYLVLTDRFRWCDSEKLKKSVFCSSAGFSN